MSLNEWITVIAVLSALWGIVVTFWAPQTWKFKVLALIPFVVLGVAGWWLVRVQSKQQGQAEYNNRQEQLRLHQEVSDTKRQVETLQGQVNEVHNKLSEPSAPADKVQNIADLLGVRLPIVKDLPVIPLNGITVRGGLVQRLDLLMKAAGYSGPTAMSVLIVISDEGVTKPILVGTRLDLTPKNALARLEGGGDYYNFPGGDNTNRVYVFSEADGKINVQYRQR